jgi:hypothetical protein
MGSYGLTGKAPYSPFGQAGGGGGGQYDITTQDDNGVADSGTWNVTGVGYIDVSYMDANNPSTTTAVPTMTGPTTPSGTAFASSEFGTPGDGFDAWNAFDGDISSRSTGAWANDGTTETTTGWIAYTFSSPTVIDKVSIRARDFFGTPKNTTQCLQEGVVEASNDGFATAPVLLYTFPTQSAWSAFEIRYFAFTNTTAYTSYRIRVTQNAGDPNYTAFQEVEFIEYTGPYGYTRQEEGTDFTFSDPGGSGDRTLTFTNTSGQPQDVRTEHVFEA